MTEDAERDDAAQTVVDIADGVTPIPAAYRRALYDTIATACSVQTQNHDCRCVTAPVIRTNAAPILDPVHPLDIEDPDGQVRMPVYRGG